MCNSGKTHRKTYKAEHDKGFGHRQLLELHQFKSAHPDQDTASLEQEHETQRAVVQDSLMELLRAMGSIPVAEEPTSAGQEQAPLAHSPVLDWGLGDNAEPVHFAPSYEQEVAQNVARQLYAFLDSDSDDEDQERDPEDVEEAAPPPEVSISGEFFLCTVSMMYSC